MSSESNDGLPTTGNRVGCAFSAGVAVTGVDPTPEPAYFCSCFEAAWVLSEELKVTVDQLTALLLVPRHLGGFPVVNYSGFCYRGQMDPLASSISVVVSCKETHPHVYKEISRLVDCSPSSHRDFTLLIKDPFSLCINMPLQPENAVRSMLRQNLPGVVKILRLPLFFPGQFRMKKAGWSRI